MAGFGNVGRRFAQLMLEKSGELKMLHDVDIRLAGVATRSRGTLFHEDGIEWAELLEMERLLGRFDENHPSFCERSPIELIEVSNADVFIELTTLSIHDGQPAAGYIERAFECGMDVVSANKGPEAWHYDRLNNLAAALGRKFLFETIVMDGTPVFNLVRENLRGNKILGMRGILNSTTNFILQQLERGMNYGQAIGEAQRMQLAEADPSMDVDGWDGAAKICALSNILMDARMTPRDVEVQGISHIAFADIEAARKQNAKIKYLCTARTDASGNLKLQVRPELLPPDDPLFNVNGTSAALTLYTDLAGEISIVQTNPGILQTAYGVYSDLLTLVNIKEGNALKSLSDRRQEGGGARPPSRGFCGNPQLGGSV